MAPGGFPQHRAHTDFWNVSFLTTNLCLPNREDIPGFCGSMSSEILAVGSAIKCKELQELNGISCCWGGGAGTSTHGNRALSTSSWFWCDLPRAGCPVGHAQEEMIPVPPSLASLEISSLKLNSGCLRSVCSGLCHPLVAEGRWDQTLNSQGRGARANTHHEQSLSPVLRAGPWDGSRPGTLHSQGSLVRL